MNMKKLYIQPHTCEVKLATGERLMWDLPGSGSHDEPAPIRKSGPSLSPGTLYI